jgi:hypothetical protein
MNRKVESGRPTQEIRMSNVDEAFKKVEEEHKVWLKQEEDRVRELNARNSRWAVIEKRNAKRRKERKRAPRTAPGDLEIVQAFVNTKPRWKRKKDELSSPGALGAWLTRHRLLTGSVELTQDDLRRALDVRDGIHALLKANNGAELGGRIRFMTTGEPFVRAASVRTPG